MRQYPCTTPRGFEPLRSKTTHLAGEPLNHSGKVSLRLSIHGCRTEKMQSVRADGKKKRRLHVRESNPGRLRDRQKCYQLHQHGPTNRDTIETLPSLFVDPYRVGIQHKNLSLIIRSYHGGSTASHPNCEVKHLWAQSVLRWGTTRESWVSNVFLTFFFFGCRMFFF